MTRPLLPIDVYFYVEIYIDDRILGSLNEGQKEKFVDALLSEGAIEVLDYDNLTVSFDHGDEDRARATVRAALDHVK